MTRMRATRILRTTGQTKTTMRKMTTTTMMMSFTVLSGHPTLCSRCRVGLARLTTSLDAEAGFTVEVVYEESEDNDGEEDEDDNGTQRGEGEGRQTTLGGIFGELLRPAILFWFAT